MSVYIQHIIRATDTCPCTSYRETLSFASRISKQLAKRLHTKVMYDVHNCNPKGGKPYYTCRIILNDWNMELTLHKDFWEVDAYCDYYEITTQTNGVYYHRLDVCELARALEQNEAWHTDESHLSNSRYFHLDENTACADWLRYAQQTDEGITEFRAEDYMCDFEEMLRRYRPIYHDNFADVAVQREGVIRNLPEGYTMPLFVIRNFNFVHLQHGKKRAFYNYWEKKIMLEGVDDIAYLYDEIDENNEIQAYEYIIYKHGKSALFDTDGKQMSEFMDGKWELCKPKADSPYYDENKRIRIVFNEQAQLMYFATTDSHYTAIDFEPSLINRTKRKSLY